VSFIVTLEMRGKLLTGSTVSGQVWERSPDAPTRRIVYQATPRDPLVLAGVAPAMLSLGLLARWIPAQRALSIDPAILLREE